eukprot:9497215-Pyramimonas_sp.AAC.1
MTKPSLKIDANSRYKHPTTTGPPKCRTGLPSSVCNLELQRARVLRSPGRPHGVAEGGVVALRHPLEDVGEQ